MKVIVILLYIIYIFAQANVKCGTTSSSLGFLTTDSTTTTKRTIQGNQCPGYDWTGNLKK
jgi:hypothetical protein